MKLQLNKQLSPSLNILNGKTSPYGIKVVLRHYHFRSDTKLGPGVVALRIIPYSCHYFTQQLSLPWDYKIKYACYKKIYGRVYYCKYSIILGYLNNGIIINFIYYDTYDVDYEHINRTIHNGNVTNMSLIISKGNYVAIDADDNSLHGY